MGTLRKIRLMIWIILLLAVVIALISIDSLRPPEKQLTSKALLAAIDFHSENISPLLNKAGFRCKFEPTCSEYSRQAIQRYGAFKGMKLAIKRISRCTPWASESGYDPVPVQ